MKISLTIFALSLILFASGQNPHAKIEPIVNDLNNDGRYDTIFIYATLDNSSSFNKIVVSISGYARQSFKAKNQWTYVDSSFLKNNKNLANSNQLFLYKTSHQSVILLCGILDGAGYREDLSIITIKNNKAVMVFDKGDEDDIEVPVTLSDINGDSKTEFIFRNFGELYEPVDSLNADIGTYNPYFVYTIDADFRLNKPLTKKYNEAHYVFAGYDDSEKIKVLYPRDNGKPKILK